jgi:hypothetical protein
MVSTFEGYEPMISPFSKPRTPQEWRATARLIQEQLQGLSIDELMRGGAKHSASQVIMTDAYPLPVSRAFLRAIPMEDSGQQKLK